MIKVRLMKDVIVTGGRDYNDVDKLKEVLDSINIGHLVQGGATGADQLAKEYAQNNQISYVTFEAYWKTQGLKAGPIRNRKMLEAFPDALVVAFPGGRGTANCIEQAIDRNMTVLKVM